MSDATGTLAPRVAPDLAENEARMNPARSQAWFTLLVLFGINAMNFYDRQILAAVTEPIRKEWALNDSAMGLLGTAFILLYAAVGVPLMTPESRPK